MDYKLAALITKMILLAIVGGVGLLKLTAPERYYKYRRILIGLLFICVAMAWLSFFHYGRFLAGNFNNYHDIFHYYFGAKYSEEVGYWRLYECVAVAESEFNPVTKRFKESKFRVMETYEHVPISEALKNPDFCKKHFSPERWELFKQDIQSFLKIYHIRSLRARIKDMGYNATPAWNVAGNLLAEVVPVTRWGMVLIGWIDLILIGIAFISIIWAFGLETSLITMVFFLSIYPLQRMFIHGSMLRFDWIVCVLAGISFMKMRYYKVSGALLAYAGLMRLFPALFVFGFGIKFIFDTIASKRIAPKYIAFFGAYLATVLLLLTASTVHSGGFDSWEQFSKKIQIHRQSITGYRIGLKYVMMWEGESNRKDFKKITGRSDWATMIKHKHQVLEKRQPAFVFVAAIFILMIGYLCRRMKDHETVALSYCLVYLLLSPTLYYSVMISVLALLFLSREKDRIFSFNFAILIIMMIFQYVYALSFRFVWFRHFLVNISFLSYITLICATLLMRDEKAGNVLQGVWHKIKSAAGR